jgi:hypothetical protein
MEIRARMQEHVDNTGWAALATTVGMLISAHGLVQYVTAMFTLASGIVLSHFLKRFLQQRESRRKARIGREEE